MWIFILFTGLLATFSQCSETEFQLEFNGHKSAMYLIDNKIPARTTNGNGISYMFQKINEQLAIHALFHYQNNIFAANITKIMLQNAIQSELSKHGAGTKVNWKIFLERELNIIEKRLMRPGLSDEQAVSKTSAAIIIVDGNEVTQAKVGHSRIVSFASDSKESKTRLRVKESPPTKVKNQRNPLGGQFFADKSPNIHDRISEVTELSDVRFIIVGTVLSWFANIYEVAQILSKNANNLRVAAHEVTNLIVFPRKEKNNGVIVIGLNPFATISVPDKADASRSAVKIGRVPVVSASKCGRKLTKSYHK